MSTQFAVDVPADPNVDRVRGERKPLPLKRFCVDGCLAIGMPLCLELFCRIYGPYERGFFCDDESIRHQWKPNTISTFTLAMFVLIPNMLVVLTTEVYRLHLSNSTEEFYSQYEAGRRHSGRLVVRFAIFHGYFIACEAVIMTLTSATKYPVGRLRPHFMDVCRPNVGYDACNTTSEITDYHCTTGWSASILEARLSFFSGHSSLSLGAAMFGVLYLQDRLAGQVRSYIMVPVMQTLYMCTALYIAYSRIFDNWHHWSDVLVGSLVGMIVMAFLCKYVVGLQLHKRCHLDENAHLLDHKKSQAVFCNFCRFQGILPQFPLPEPAARPPSPRELMDTSDPHYGSTPMTTSTTALV